MERKNTDVEKMIKDAFIVHAMSGAHLKTENGDNFSNI